MGRRGPKPTADSVLKTRGSNVPRSRERRREQVESVAGGDEEPTMPTWLSAEERKIWTAMMPTLFAMGVVSVADNLSLGRYCHVMVEWIAVMRKVRTSPRLVKPAKGTAAYQNPLLKMKSELAKELQSLEDRFGLTPAARMTLNVTAMFRPGYRRPTKVEPMNPPPSPPSGTPPPPPIGGERFFRGG